MALSFRIVFLLLIEFLPVFSVDIGVKMKNVQIISQQKITQNTKQVNFHPYIEKSDWKKFQVGDYVKGDPLKRRFNLDPDGWSLERMERERGVFRRKYNCNIIGELYNQTLGDFGPRITLHKHKIPRILFRDLSCNIMRDESRRYCLDYVKELIGSQIVPALTKRYGTRDVCQIIKRTVLPKEHMRLSLAYHVEQCPQRIYRNIGNTCCWRCRNGKHFRSNAQCSSNPPTDCVVESPSRM